MKHLITIILLCLTTLASAAPVMNRNAYGVRGTAQYPYNPFPLTNGLVGAWLVDGYTSTTLATNLVSGNPNLTLSSYGSVYTTNISGFQTTYYDGASASKAVSTNNLTPTNVTFAMWIYRFTDGGNQVQGGVIDSGSWVNGYFFTRYGQGADVVTFDINNYNTRFCSSSVGRSNWVFLCGTHDGFSTKAYTNGVLAKSVVYTGSVVYASTSGFWVGGWLNSTYAQRAFIDTVSVFNTALSSNDIFTLYTNGRKWGRHQ